MAWCCAVLLAAARQARVAEPWPLSAVYGEEAEIGASGAAAPQSLEARLAALDTERAEVVALRAR